MAGRLLARLPGRHMGRRTRRVYLHIGAMKTGTTYLQGLMEANRAELAADGILFPGQRWNDQHLGVRELIFDTEDPEVGSITHGKWDSLVHEIHAHPGRASVLSMEFLSYIDSARARTVLSYFDDFEVHVILGIRDAERAIPAQWQTAVSNGSRLTFQKFVRGARYVRHGQHSPQGRGSHLFQRTQGIPRMLEVWRPLVGPDRLHVFTVPPSGSDPSLLWSRFAEIVDVDPAVAIVPTTVANPSLGHPSSELMRRINVALGHVPKVDYWTVAANNLAFRILRARAGMERPVRLHRPGVRLAREWNGVVRQAVEDHGVPVTGSLEDLPIGPPADENLPTRLYEPSPEELLAAADTAIDGLLELRAEFSRDAGLPEPPRGPHAAWEDAVDPVGAAVAEVVHRMRECMALRPASRGSAE